MQHPVCSPSENAVELGQRPEQGLAGSGAERLRLPTRNRCHFRYRLLAGRRAGPGQSLPHQHWPQGRHHHRVPRTAAGPRSRSSSDQPRSRTPRRSPHPARRPDRSQSHRPPHSSPSSRAHVSSRGARPGLRIADLRSALPRSSGRDSGGTQCGRDACEQPRQ